MTEENYTDRENVWDQQWPVTDETEAIHPRTEIDVYDEEEPFPNVVGTSDVIESIRDAEPYMPPTDPPVLPGGNQGIHVATGFGRSTEEEAVLDGPPRGDEDIHDQVLEILQNDSLTSTLPLDVLVDRGVVYLKGQVSSINDADHAMAILDELPGIAEVVDHTTIEPSVG